MPKIRAILEIEVTGDSPQEDVLYWAARLPNGFRLLKLGLEEVGE